MGNVTYSIARYLHVGFLSASSESAMIGAAAAATALVLGSMATATATGLVLLLRRISASVELAPPTPQQWKEEDPTKQCALFRHLPEMADKLAFRSLGAKGKTPIHIGRIDSENISFLIKREDLILDDYGGNKVRTLQHQLAVCEARRENGERAFRQLVSLGSGGSNQIVATTVHAQKVGYNGQKACINPCWFDPDEPDLDNTINMLSVLSFPNLGFIHDWGMTIGILGTLRVLQEAWTQRNMVPMMLGGNCPAGVLGQAGGLLELAEQVVDGSCPDVERIYVPIGSACTISGLILGSVLVRHLGIQALQSESFQIIGCNVHDGFAKGDRLLGLHVNPWFSFLPMTISHSVLEACKALVELGGPDLKEKVLDFIQHHVDLRSDKDVVGEYGAHSDLSRKAALQYDTDGSVTNFATGKKEKELWVCGHFVAKAFQPMVEDLKSQQSSSKGSTASNENQLKYMLWMTKSAVQPRGEVDEWSRFKERSNEKVKKWANEGKAESTFRPGRVSTKNGTPEDYRSIMTKVA